MNSDLMWGAKGIARYMNRSVDFVYRLQADPDAPVYKRAGQYCARKSDIDNWLKTGKTPKQPDLAQSSQL